MRVRTAIIGLAVVGMALAQPVAGLAKNGADDPPGHDRGDDRLSTVVIRAYDNGDGNGADGPVTHDAGDDNGDGDGADDPVTHDAGDDNGDGDGADDPAGPPPRGADGGTDDHRRAMTRLAMMRRTLHDRPLGHPDNWTFSPAVTCISAVQHAVSP